MFGNTQSTEQARYKFCSRRERQRIIAKREMRMWLEHLLKVLPEVSTKVKILSGKNKRRKNKNQSKRSKEELRAWRLSKPSLGVAINFALSFLRAFD